MKNFKIAAIALVIAASFAACKGKSEEAATDSVATDTTAVVDSAATVDTAAADTTAAAADTTKKM